MVRLTERVFDMMMKRRGLVGRIVFDEIGYQRLTVKAAAKLTETSPAFLYRLKAGDARITDVKLRFIEGGFEWPSRFLTYVIEGDVDHVRMLPTGIDRGEVREELLQFTLEEMAKLPNPKD